MVYKQPLRQTEGFVRSLVKLMGVDICVPDFSTFSRRGSGLDLPLKSCSDKASLIHLVVDSTGLKIFGEGEWLQNKHKTKAKRKSWRKLHLGLDLVTGEIVCSELTPDGVGDPTALPELLDQIDGDVSRFMADGAYDGTPTSDLLVKLFGIDVEIIIPPPKTAVLSAKAAVNPTPSLPAHFRNPQRREDSLAGEQRIQSAQSRRDANGLLEDGHRPQTESAQLSKPENRSQDWHTHSEQNDRTWPPQVRARHLTNCTGKGRFKLW